MAIAQDTLQEIRQRSDIVSVIGEHVRLTRKGTRFWGLSPFKSEKTPSFCVNPEQGFYYCFSTHQGGDAIKFLMTVDHLSFVEAIEKLAKQMGIRIDVGSQQDSARGKLMPVLRELYQRLTTSFQYLLNSSDKGKQILKYLHTRGIDQTTIEKFRLGVCPEDRSWLRTFLQKRGYTDALFKESGLFSSGGTARALLAGRLIFPITNWTGDVIGFGGRIFPDGNPKYINSPDNLLFKKGAELFTEYKELKKIRDGDTVYIVEGYFDLLALYQVGVYNAVATLGTALTPLHAKKIGRLTKSVTLLFDGDAAGRQAARRSAVTIQDEGITPAVCLLPSGADPADLLLNSSEFVADPRAYLAAHTIDVITFLLNAEPSTEKNKNNPQRLAIDGVFRYISHVGSAVRQEQYLKQLADLIHVSIDAVSSDFRKYTAGEARTHSRQNEYTQSAGNSDSRFANNLSAELDCMIYSILYPEGFEYVRSQIDQSYLENSDAVKLLHAQEDAFLNGNNDTDNILSHITDQRLLAEIQKRGDIRRQNIDGGRLVHSAVNTLKERYLLRCRHAIIEQLQELTNEDQTQDNTAEKLQHEIIYLNNEINKYHQQAKK